MLKRFRTYLLAGMAIVLPVGVTLYALWSAFTLIDKIFATLVVRIVGKHVPGLGLLITVLVLFWTGIAATNGYFRRLIALIESGVNRIPVVGTLYSATHQLVEVILGKNQYSFKQVVAVEYPRLGVHSIGFLTNEGVQSLLNKTEPMVAVFLPSIPNPTTGWLLVLPKEEVIVLDLSVEHALRMLLSGGVSFPNSRNSEEKPQP